MIGYIKGRITYVGDSFIIIENNGIGFEVNVPNPALFSGEKDKETEVYTAMMVREDDISLCGFKDRADLLMFRKLLGVNGVGTKAALAILSIMRAEELSKAIVFEDAASITKAPGVGKKSAQRIILELRDKVDDISGFTKEDRTFVPDSFAGETETAGDPKAEALEALVALGYSRSEAASALSKVKEDLPESQDYIKMALGKLMKA